MIQIDMPMPRNCLDCPACNEYLTCAIPVNGRGWGENDVKDYNHGRPEWCPMKEQEEGKYTPCKVKTKTGKWDGEKCSVCGSTYIGSAPHKWRYCPDCGVKMEGR